MSTANFSLTITEKQDLDLDLNSLNIPNSFFYTENSNTIGHSSNFYLEEEAILNNLAEL